MNTNELKKVFLSLANALPLRGLEGILGEAGTQILGSSLVIRGGVVLYAEAADQYFAALERLVSLAKNDPAWSRSSPDETLMECLKPIITSGLTDKTLLIRNQTSLFLERLNRAPSHWQVDISVFGLSHEFAGLCFGQLRFFLEDVESSVSISGFIDKGKASRFLLVRLSVEAVDSDSALVRAKTIVDEHLSVLNALCCSSSPSQIRLSRRTESRQKYSISQISATQHAEPKQTIQAENIGRLLQRPDYDYLFEKRGGSFISKRLTSATPFARRSTTAYVSAGNAVIELESHLAFLLYAIALESAILGKDIQSELSHQLSVRIAHLLGSNLESRREIVTVVKRLYALRSKVVHTGETEIAPADLAEMRSVCLATLFALVVAEPFKDIETIDELDQWFSDQVLGSAEARITV